MWLTFSLDHANIFMSKLNQKGGTMNKANNFITEMASLPIGQCCLD
jgi:hypothetical protein